MAIAKKSAGASGMKLPSAEDFAGVTVADAAESLPPGTVVDLDYDAWAPAIVDLADPENRIESNRARLAGRGYQRVGGEVQVTHFPKAEVWVIPRSLYDERTKAERKELHRMVREGRLTGSATAKPVLTGMDGDD